MLDLLVFLIGILMKKHKQIYLIVNFGGPRDLAEVSPFLQALLTDQDVLRTNLPAFIHRLLFSYVAKKRAKVIAEDYALIGGKSPIYDDTEQLADVLRKRLDGPVITFHRYLPATHQEFIKNMQSIDCEEIRVFPLFPQFTYATTGSIARWLSEHLPKEIINKMRWVKSYSTHPTYISAQQQAIRRYLDDQQLKDEETILLFSAHGLPQLFSDRGDVYEYECNASFSAVMEAFPQIQGRLSYQSKFGRGEWLKPYTIDVCEKIKSWCGERKQVVFVPISFTSDHIETLFEVEEQYMTVIVREGLNAYRVPALTLNAEWIDSIVTMIQEKEGCSSLMLIRPKECPFRWSRIKNFFRRPEKVAEPQQS